MLWVLALSIIFFSLPCLMYYNISYYIFSKNKSHNILFIEKKSNILINEKNITLPFENITCLGQLLKIYAIKSLFDFSRSKIVIICINYILTLNF